MRKILLRKTMPILNTLHPSLHPFGKISLEFKIIVRNVKHIFEAN